MLKQIVTHSAAPVQIKAIQFGISSPQEIAAAAHIEVNTESMYEGDCRVQTRGGPLDPRLGAIDKQSKCETCKETLTDCIGHSGFIKLALPVFHAGYFKATLKALQMICKHCSKVLLDPRLRYRYVELLRSRSSTQKNNTILRDIWEKSRKVKVCPYCDRRNGTVKKIGALRIVHYPDENKPPSKKKEDDDDDDYNNEYERLPANPAFTIAVKDNPDLKKHILKAADDLTPLRVLQIFEKVPPEDVILLDMDPECGRPERMLLQYFPIPPLCIRPTVCQDPSAGSNEDDLTIKAFEIVRINTVIAQAVEKGGTPSYLFELWDQLQYDVARYINSDMPGLPTANAKPIRGVSQRLKGKQGRFRGNLSGKRVDFSGRTVISPDPNLRIDQVGVPVLVARTLTYPERATTFNMEQLRKSIINGADKHPGANFVEFPDGTKRYLKYASLEYRGKIADELRPGTIVERHIRNGDVVLFNRQPSLHRISIMAHYVKISPHRTFRFNECVCAPYNADFDGDEMNLHVPQTEEARAEAIELMGVVNNILTPKSGEPLVACTQDFITSSYLVTAKNEFFDRAEFCRILAMMSNAEFSLPLPEPAMMKPMEMWTGKQLFTVLVQSAARFVVGGVSRSGTSEEPSNVAYVTTEVAEKGFVSPRGIDDIWWHDLMCPRDAYVIFRGGELMCGQLGKKSLGDGSKKSVLYILSRECGNQAAAFAMNCIARFSARWHSENGFSIGIDDVTPNRKLRDFKQHLMEEGYKTCDQYMQEYSSGTLQAKAGCTLMETLETNLNNLLSGIRTKAGDLCPMVIDRTTNAALTMAMAGSKGSTINMSQMIACVGQQTVGGGRAADGFYGRTLPHFELGIMSRSAKAKGFVANSFFSGLSATEFFMHAQSGREGLTDTAVKTAETGYMQRRLMKALEDLHLNYDFTVRSSDGSIVQMCYGDEGFDPMQMETGNDTPVNFERVLTGVQCALKNERDPFLEPDELIEYSRRVLRELHSKLLRDGIIPPLDADNRGGLVFTLDKLGEFFAKVADDQIEHGSSSAIRASHVNEMLRVVLIKLHRSAIQPGTAVGAVSAQSIGEPGTQMTLKTFHFAGVASMNVTQGVPRLKEIINASKKISTPITTCQFDCDTDEIVARVVKGRVESTTLGEIARYIKEVHRPDMSYIAIRIDLDAIRMLGLDITLEKVAEKIIRVSIPKTKITVDDVMLIEPDKLRVIPVVKNDMKRFLDAKARSRDARRKEKEAHLYYVIQNLKEHLQKVSVCGIPSVSRAVISQKGAEQKYELAIESSDMQRIMVISGIRGTEVKCNHIMAVEKVLGIEAAR